MFLNDWAADGQEGLKRDFDITDEDLQGVRVLFASYCHANYSGDAFVLFERDGKLWEVNGGHCSCYGLEGQWEPAETALEVLTHRLEKGKLGDGYDHQYAAELRGVLAQVQT